jgi:hypothetical protein
MERTFTLTEAISILNQFNDREVVSIMYEDGSKRKFCFMLEGDKTYTFIDLALFVESLSAIQEIMLRHNLKP